MGALAVLVCVALIGLVIGGLIVFGLAITEGED